MAISQYGNEYYGLSGDDKPLGTPLNGRKFTEIDTSKEYRYDAENQQWLQQSGGGGGGGSSTLSGLTDVDISEPADGQTLVYNATSGKWENGEGGGGGGVHIIGSQSADDATFLTVTAGQLYGWLQNNEYTVLVQAADGGHNFTPISGYAFDEQHGYAFQFGQGFWLSATADEYPEVMQ